MRITTRRLLLLIAIGGLVPSLSFPGFSGLAQQDRSHVDRKAQDAAALKLKTELISVQVAVTDQRGRAVSGLTPADFRIYEDKIEQPVSFFSDHDSPASVAVVFDSSHSMADSKIEQARAAVARFVETSNLEDEYSLITFNDNARVLLEMTHNSAALL